MRSLRILFIVGLSMIWVNGARAQQPDQAPPVQSSASEQALNELLAEVGRLFAAGVLTYEQKVDIGRICEQLLFGGEEDEPIPLELIQDRTRLLNEIITPEQRDQAQLNLEEQARKDQRKYVVVFEMEWPAELFERWAQACDLAEYELMEEQGQLRRIAAQVNRDVRSRAFTPPEDLLPGEARENPVSDALRLELYLRKLDCTPYVGYKLDTRILEDPALSPAQKNELSTRMLARALLRHAPRDPLTQGLVSLEPTPAQLERLWGAYETALEELKTALPTCVAKVESIRQAQQWFRVIFYREAKLGTLLTQDQKACLRIVKDVMDNRVRMSFRFNEIPREGILEIDRVNKTFDEAIAEIPRRTWGRNMVYQEAQLDHQAGYLRVAMKSHKLPVEHRGRIADGMLRSMFPTFYTIFTSAAQGLLDGWPLVFPGKLPAGVTTHESLSPQHWVRIYEIASRKGIWEKLLDARLSHLARFIAAQVGDGKADEMYVLENYKLNRAYYQFMEGLFSDPAFTPLQKLLLFESYWNSIGPYSAYYYVLDLDADRFYERINKMRKLLVFCPSWPPDTQLIYSVEDIAQRQRRSIESVHRWTEFGGHFSPEEMKTLQARRDELLARINEWGRYVPPDPNKPEKEESAFTFDQLK